MAILVPLVPAMLSRIVLLASDVKAPLLPSLLFDQAMNELLPFGVMLTWPPVLPLGTALAPPAAVAPVRTRTRRVAPLAPVGVAVTVMAMGQLTVTVASPEPLMSRLNVAPVTLTAPPKSQKQIS